MNLGKYGVIGTKVAPGYRVINNETGDAVIPGVMSQTHAAIFVSLLGNLELIKEFNNSADITERRLINGIVDMFFSDLEALCKG